MNGSFSVCDAPFLFSEVDMPELQEKFVEFITALRNAKPNDRSEKDRYFAIVITEVEKAFAVFMTFVR